MIFVNRCIGGFEILHGDVQGLPDTIAFLRSLAALVNVVDAGVNTEKCKREHKAAARVFNWEVFFIEAEVTVTKCYLQRLQEIMIIYLCKLLMQDNQKLSRFL